jgi:hypothetical protein
MKNDRFKLVLVVVMFCMMLPVKSYAYQSYACGFGGNTHRNLAYDVFDVYSLKPYFNELTRLGYNLDTFATHANYEPDPQHSWGYLFANSLYDFDLDDYNTGYNLSRGCTTTDEFSFGALLHALADSAVPAKHAPVEWEDDAAHDLWENKAIDIVPNYNSQPLPTEYLCGSYAAKQTALYALKSAYVAVYHTDYNSMTSSLWTSLQYEAVKTMQIAADAVLKQYFDSMNLLAPSYILIDWTFDEGDTTDYGSNHQFVYNHRGSLNANLMRGRTIGTDSDDGVWDTGCNQTGAWHGGLLSENNNTQTCCKSINWTAYEARTLTKVGVDSKSYAIEFVVNPDTLPTSSVCDSVNPPTLMNFYDISGGPGMWHLTGFYKSQTTMHDCVRFDYRTSSDTNDSLTIDLTSKGMTITPGKWYYVAVNYDHSVAAATGTIQFIVGDIAAGVYKVVSKPALPSKLFAATSTPLMLIGGDSNEANLRPFDGKIDRVRIHNTSLAASTMLYGNLTFVKGDVNKDGRVDFSDFAVISDSWLYDGRPFLNN